MNGGQTTEARPSVKKIVAYSVAVFLLASFQASVGSRIGLMSATPSFTLILTALAAIFDGKRFGSAVGLAGGALTDALGGSGFSLLPLFYVLIGWFLGEVTEHLGHPGRHVGLAALRSLMWLAAAAGVGALSTAIMILLSAGRMNFFSSIPQILLPEAVGTFLYSIPMLVIFMLCHRKKFSDDNGGMRYDR